jgi:predicted nuclease with TOPRIM domain
MAQDEVFLTRLDRLEVKLDKLTEAVSAIARVEEKVYSSNKRVDRLEYRMDLIEADVDKAKEEVINKNAQTVKATERFFWVAISAIVSVAVYMVR